MSRPARPAPTSRPAGRLTGRRAALIEQGLVSGASFVAFLGLARALAPEAWGSFGLAYALVLFAQGFQRALVTLPMVSFSSFGAGLTAPAAGDFPGRAAWAAANAGVAGIAALLLALAAGGAFWAGLAWGLGAWVAQALAMAAVMMVPAMAHEFARRAAVQAQQMGLLAGMGGVFAAVLLGLAFLPWPLAWQPGRAWHPALAMGLAWTASACVPALARRHAPLAWPGRPPVRAGYGRFSGWALGGHLAYSGYNFGVQALLGALAGPAALGAFQACRALVQPVSTLQAALDSIDKPQAAAALAQAGPAGLHRRLARSLAAVVLLALPYLACVALAATPLLTLAYGEAYGGQGAVVLLWCVVAGCSLLSQPLESGLYVAQRTRALFWGRLLAAALSLAAALPLIQHFGAAGALAAMALGYAVAAAASLCTLARLRPASPEASPPSPAPSPSFPSTPPPAMNLPQPPAPAAPRAVYLAWAAFQRRQVSMADTAGFDCLFMPMPYKGRSHARRAWHYLLLFIHTMRVLRERRPPVAWLQLPQMPLLWAALVYRLLFDRQLVLVADCHNAVFRPPWSRVPLGLRLLGRCEAVLVHNRDMLGAALALGVPAARLRVLEDVPPPPREAGTPPVPAAFAGRPHPWLLFAGSYGQDEPVAEVLQAARQLGTGVVAITGRLSNAARNGHDITRPPPNVVLTGYLPLAEFEALMTHCDAVLAFTRHDGIQLSVCSEALGFGRPLVVSDTPLLRDLFGAAGVMTDSADPAAIVRAVHLACAENAARAAASRALAAQRRQQWQAGPLQACLALLRGPAGEAP